MHEFHVAIIMDGNGRWAEERGWPRTRGHRAGADAVRRTVEAASSLGVSVLTLYAFSADNWKRPEHEVKTLLSLFRRFLDSEARTCLEKGVRLSVIGRRDRLPPELVYAIEQAELQTAEGEVIHLRLAVDYSARDAILRAASTGRSGDLTRIEFRELLSRAIHEDRATPDVDLLIRTGREQRLSDFLLWESAYAELYFTDQLWPDFAASDLEKAIQWFQGRSRRFGAIPHSTRQPASDGIGAAP